MSSDEEGPKTPEGTRRYVIHELPWRAQRITVFVRTLDLIRRQRRCEPRGSPFRHREEGDLVSKRPAVHKLPTFSYNDSWLKGLSDMVYFGLDVREDAEELDLSLSVTNPYARS